MEARKVHITKVSKECIRVVFIQRNRPSSSKSKEPEVLGSVQLPPKWNELRVLNTIPEETVELIVDRKPLTMPSRPAILTRNLAAAKFHFPKAEIATKASTPKLPEEVHSGNEEEKPDDPPMLSRGQQKRVSKEPPKKRRKLIASRPITRLYESTDGK